MDLASSYQILDLVHLDGLDGVPSVDQVSAERVEDREPRAHRRLVTCESSGGLRFEG